MEDFLSRFAVALAKRKSVLCVGLDPALPTQRENQAIPKDYLNADEPRLNFCLDIIDRTSDYALAAKPNEQYLFGLTVEQHQVLSKQIKSSGLISIYDCKLGDIGDTAESKLFWVHRAGYDAITVHTQPGNLRQIVNLAHGYDPPIGILALTLMSNPEATKYFKESTLNGKPVFIAIAHDVEESQADGCVVGATGHVTESDIKAIRAIVGENRVFLIPGVGAQKGDPEKAMRTGGKNVLINVGRDIIYSGDPRKKAEEYCKLFNGIANSYGQT